MSLSDLASVGSFISGVAVLISLIFLYFQLRQVTEQVKQAEKNQRASIRAVRATRIIDIVLKTVEPSVADAMWLGHAADERMTDTQLHQFTQWATARFWNAEDSFYQYRQGLLDDTAFKSLNDGLMRSLSQPGLRAVYKRLRAQYGGEFVAHVDGILKETENARLSDDTASWRTALAAERAAMGGGT